MSGPVGPAPQLAPPPEPSHAVARYASVLLLVAWLAATLAAPRWVPLAADLANRVERALGLDRVPPAEPADKGGEP